MHARHLLLTLTLASALLPALASAQLAPVFTYQGRLEDGGQPKNGTVDLLFTPFNAAASGTALSAPLVIDAAPVVNGLFSVRVDLGPGVFLGDPIFLEIGVREDALGGAGDLTGFTTLAPRQEVTPAPYALHAEGVAFDAITGAQIAPNSIAGSDVIDGTLTASDANTTSTTIGLQRRLSAACPAGQAVRDISATGAPTCLQPITSVTAVVGSGINASTAAGGVVTLTTDANEAQTRLSGECQANPAAAIRELNVDGSVQCVRVAATPTPAAAVVLDSVGDVGSHLSVGRSEGASSISTAYYDDSNNRLKFVHCASNACSPAPTPVVIDDPVNDVGQFVSLASTISGATGMAYYDASAGDLKFAACTPFDCTGTIAVRTIDGVGADVGRFAEVVTFGSGFGIAYYDTSNNVYKWALCNDANCSAPTITVLSDISGGGILASDIASFRNSSAGTAKPTFFVIRGGSEVTAVLCSDNACTTRSTRVMASGDVGPPLAATARTVGGQLRLWVAYARPAAVGSFTLKVCLEPSCTQIGSLSGSVLSGAPLGLALVARNEGTLLALQTASNDSRLGVLDFATLTFSALARHLTGTATANGAVDATLLGLGPVGGIGIVYFDTAARDLVYQRCQQSNCGEL